jgi:hypothetical protein
MLFRRDGPPVKPGAKSLPGERVLRHFPKTTRPKGGKQATAYWGDAFAPSDREELNAKADNQLRWFSAVGLSVGGCDL